MASELYDGFTYKIVRRYANGKKTKLIDRGKMISEAKRHCESCNASSMTAKAISLIRHTKEHGAWFDTFEKE